MFKIEVSGNFVRLLLQVEVGQKADVDVVDVLPVAASRCQTLLFENVCQVEAMSGSDSELQFRKGAKVKPLQVDEIPLGEVRQLGPGDNVIKFQECSQKVREFVSPA
jgi:hypothetical protein